jgi:lipopolysaccharide transport system permease protein
MGLKRRRGFFAFFYLLAFEIIALTKVTFPVSFHNVILRKYFSVEELKTITAEPDSIGVYVSKLWKYRTLLVTFAKRDLKIKYAQTLFGFFWVVLQPFPSIVIFTFFFGSLIKVDTGTLPYPVFALVGMIGWNYFTNLTSGVGNSLIESQHILKKIYFPKLLLPLSKILSSGVDFLIAFGVVMIAMLIYGVIPSAYVLLLPFFVLLNILCGLSIGIWISALTFRYRDFQHIAPYLINFSVWLTPVFYPTTILPSSLEYIMYMNPMALTIEGYRYSLVGGDMPNKQYMTSIIPVLLLLFSGLWYFRQKESQVNDFV